MELIYEGHACFTVLCQGLRILIDPYLSGNPLCKKKPQEMQADLILVTHGHSDHLGDALTIAKNTGATLVGQVDLFRALSVEGLNTVGFQFGGEYVHQGIRIRMTPAWHGNSVWTPSGYQYAGVACGYLISDGKTTLYHAGDTCLFGDMKMVIAREPIHCALLPIGGYFTMGPTDAACAAQWLGADLVVPMHYNTFAQIQQDPYAFAKLIEAQGQRCQVMRMGEQIEI